MRYLLASAFLFLLVNNLLAQHPRNFSGKWSGQLTIYGAMDKSTTVPMQLNVSSKDSAGVYSWQLIYGDSGKDIRAYELVPVDTLVGKWNVDEKNGIVISGIFRGNNFITSFEVQGTRITMIYSLQGDTMVVEVIAGTDTGILTSGKGTEDVPTVTSYGVNSYQRAELKRQ